MYQIPWVNIMELIKFTTGKQRAVNSGKCVTHNELSADSWSLEILTLCENKLAKYTFIQDCLLNETLNSEWNKRKKIVLSLKPPKSKRTI